MRPQIIKCRDENGNWTEVDLSSVKQPPVQHDTLTDEQLSKIAAIHAKIKDVMLGPSGGHVCLESFELLMMREVDVDASIKLWDFISEVFRLSCEHFAKDRHRQVYQWIILLITRAITDEDMKKEEVKIIMKYFIEQSKKHEYKDLAS